MPIEINETRLFSNIEHLVSLHAPSGYEAEVDLVVKEIISCLGNEYIQDSAGNIIVKVPGHNSDHPIAIISHKDEISLIVKRVEENGHIRVVSVGGLHPWAIGETPVELLTENSILPGVLSVGAKHVSIESPAGDLKDGKGLSWERMWVDCKLSPIELSQRGIGPGTRVVIARHRKKIWEMEQYICGYNLDCRAGLAIIFEVAQQLSLKKPQQDVYLIASEREEIGGHGASFALANLPVETAIAVDIAPVSPEYDTKNNDQPILIEKDSRGVYHAATNRHLRTLAQKEGFGVQNAVVTSYGSDSSIAQAAGHVGRSSLVGYPGDNTHGYEICSKEAIVNSVRLLTAFTQDPLSNLTG
ncbi:MAG: M42 family peptidase [Candidatus Latescibacterota bacterium]|nr:M42 family peptidase [Candidatus Latescibacterota bacterium]